MLLGIVLLRVLRVLLVRSAIECSYAKRHMHTTTHLSVIFRRRTGNPLWLRVRLFVLPGILILVLWVRMWDHSPRWRRLVRGRRS